MKRFTISVDDEIGTFIDTLVKQYGYSSRSELIRDLAWEKKAEFEIKDNIEVIGILTLSYNHEDKNVEIKLNQVGHQRTHLILFSTHIHATKERCVEIIALKGLAKEVRDFSIKLCGIRGIYISKLTMIPIGKEGES